MANSQMFFLDDFLQVKDVWGLPLGMESECEFNYTKASFMEVEAHEFL